MLFVECQEIEEAMHDTHIYMNKPNKFIELDSAAG